jgi:hypothetical protein
MRMLSHEEAQELHRLVGGPIQLAASYGESKVSVDVGDLERARELAAILVSDTMPGSGETETVTFEWSTEKGRCQDCGLPAGYQLKDVAIDGGPFLLCSVDAAYHAAHGDTIEYLFEEEEEHD